MRGVRSLNKRVAFSSLSGMSGFATYRENDIGLAAYVEDRDHLYQSSDSHELQGAQSQVINLESQFQEMKNKLRLSSQPCIEYKSTPLFSIPAQSY